MKSIYLLVYYLFARFLPKSTTPIIGKFSKAFREFLCVRIFTKAGKKLNIENGVYFGNGSGICVGDEVGFGQNVRIHNMRLNIGNYVMIGTDTFFQGGGHLYDDLSKPIAHQGGVAEKSHLTIGDDVWIGVRVLFLPGCKKVGTGVIVGAGSVVTKDIPDYAIVGGNPARVLKMRK